MAVIIFAKTITETRPSAIDDMNYVICTIQVHRTLTFRYETIYANEIENKKRNRRVSFQIAFYRVPASLYFRFAKNTIKIATNDETFNALPSTFAKITITTHFSGLIIPITNYSPIAIRSLVK